MSSQSRESAALSTLRLFERYRITNGHSIETFFAKLNPRRTKTVPVSDFASNITNYCDAITPAQALEITRIFDGERKSGEIAVRDVRRVLRQHSDMVTVQGLLEDGTVFPKVSLLLTLNQSRMPSNPNPNPTSTLILTLTLPRRRLLAPT